MLGVPGVAVNWVVSRIAMAIYREVAYESTDKYSLTPPSAGAVKELEINYPCRTWIYNITNMSNGATLCYKGLRKQPCSLSSQLPRSKSV